jgi:biotin carboxyl carrier protein
MPGTVVKVTAKEGDEVKAGDVLATLESMKMEYQIKATHDTTVSKVMIEAGQFVNMKQKLIAFA